MTLNYHREGDGDPLLLVHGIGSEWQIWRPVLPLLAPHRDVIAVDLPGFGASAPLPDGTEPTPRALADAVHAFAEELGLDRPHVAGNSLGGWVALELARAGRVRSATGISPAGLWASRAPRSVTAQLKASRWLSRTMPEPVLQRLSSSPAARTLSMSNVFARPQALPAAEAFEAARAFGAAPGFEAALAATRGRRFTRGAEITVPLTVAFGDKERLLTKRRCQHRGELPPHTRWPALPGCGHTPTWDAPELVAQVILDGSAA